MTILELVVASGLRGVKLGDLAKALAAPKSSLHALTKGLVATGYLREADGAYVVGPAISSLITTESVAAQFAYRHILSDLAARWNETAMLSSLVGDSVVYLDSAAPETLIRANPTLNRRLVLWPRSSGRVFLAFMDAKRFEGYLRRQHPEPSDAEYVRSEVARTRETHIGINVGQSGTDHIGVAVPIFVGQAPVTMSLAMAGPRSRMEDKVDEIAADMLAAAGSITG
ncbi:IclR family transcriptional regulator C-terminal domain-containing protein [Pseudarthrobacter oxydans]|jgi:DNA-binding IclR family transcriptional regulator|uniref:IclR family transcriptional regulator n=1 Tax=Pseudarthrobacter oxydans TaxID=1671 RepID=UPI002AA90A1D|nr:IclR family transcriptional regulator C-terminal domain-containing protein [Pseudarthrobacter oxydans]WPU09510.1 helix-turn-helix domain-containing protein [Pseudarthrobacter oxydans]